MSTVIPTLTYPAGRDDAIADPQRERLGDPRGLDAIGLGREHDGRRAQGGFDHSDVGGFFREEGADGCKAHA